MNRNRTSVAVLLGCAVLGIIVGAIILGLFLFPFQVLRADQTIGLTGAEVPQAVEKQAVIPTLTPAPNPTVEAATSDTPALSGTVPGNLPVLYEQLNPGVVNIQVYVEDEEGLLAGQGAGSGFILDEAGHIVTNNHVVAGAGRVAVIFYNNAEREAEVVGTDDDSDLAVIKVTDLPDGVHPLPLGDSAEVQVGEWVIAIGNPFGQQSSMSVGIVSALGRTIPSGVTPFAISEAIQTDAAINPGNSGGPLLNLQGEVIGVNAQIATGGFMANSGVGFAIPANVVRRVAPVLIEHGAYAWPWLGVQGGSVNLVIMQANNLSTQQGAYIDEIVPGGPADDAGLRGSTGNEDIGGLETPVGGDVVIAVDGQPVIDFSDLLATVAMKNPNEQIQLTILRNGQQQDVTLNLEPRPENFD
jgi:2-alkenal reductase